MKAVARLEGATFRTEIKTGEELEHAIVADEPTDKGGNNDGPTAFGLLASALCACTAATLRSYANIKKLEIEAVEVEVEAERRVPSEIKEAGEGAKATYIRKKITIHGDITDEQRERMLQIAEKCPVNKALIEGVDFVD